MSIPQRRRDDPHAGFGCSVLLGVVLCTTAVACTGWEAADYTVVLDALSRMWDKLTALIVAVGGIWLAWQQIQLKRKLDANTELTKTVNTNVVVGNELTKSAAVSAEPLSHDDVNAIEANTRVLESDRRAVPPPAKKE